MVKNPIMAVVISQVTSGDFVFSEDDSGAEEGEGIFVYRGSFSIVREATQSLTTNVLSCGPKTGSKASSDSDDQLPFFEGIEQEDSQVYEVSKSSISLLERAVFVA